ncbi:class I SAM-dependent methyltransferase [Candidatus Woesearchaeota archaeon]|nr:class I SAM-dependent methyltransferase [Candidatus Woesearchaeota archaeon]
MTFELLIKPLLLIKARKTSNYCKKFLKGKFLDIGAGRCYIAKEIQVKNNVKVTCLDVKDLSQTDMKVVVYDGKNMPFKNNQFNSALIAYVLHHCEEPLAVLKEAIRVCKGNIVIFEDTKPSPITNAMDFLSNRLRGVETPFKFKTEKEWLGIFKKLNLKIVAVKHNVEREWFYPFVEHTMFVVKKDR